MNLSERLAAKVNGLEEVGLSEEAPLAMTDLPGFFRWPVVSLANATGLDVPSSLMLVLSQVAAWAGFGAGTQTVDGHWVPATFNQLVAFPNRLARDRATVALIGELDRLEAGLRRILRAPHFTRKDRSVGGVSFAELTHEPTAAELQRLTYLRDPDARTLRAVHGHVHRNNLLVAFAEDTLIQAHLQPRSRQLDRGILEELDGMLDLSDRQPVRLGRPGSTPDPIEALRASVLIQTTPETMLRVLGSEQVLLNRLLARAVHWQATLRDNPAERLPVSRGKDGWAPLQETATAIRLGRNGFFPQTRASLPVMQRWEALVFAQVPGWSGKIQERLGWVLDLPYHLFSALQVGCTRPVDNAGACATLAVRLATWVMNNALKLSHRHEAELAARRGESHRDRLARKIARRGSMSWRELLRTERRQRKADHEDAVRALLEEGRIVLGPDGRFTLPGDPGRRESVSARHEAAG